MDFTVLVNNSFDAGGKGVIVKFVGQQQLKEILSWLVEIQEQQVS